MKECLLEASDVVCGRTKGPPRHEESWWWNEECAKAVVLKKRLFGIMKSSGVGRDLEKANSDKRKYEAKRETKKVISRQREAERKRLGDCLDREEEKGNVFNIVRKMMSRNKDVVGGVA
jgi:hypothetical protein